jgi:IS5 family transposase
MNYNMSSGLPNQALQISGGIVSAASAATVEQAVAIQNLEAQAEAADAKAAAAEEVVALRYRKRQWRD